MALISIEWSGQSEERILLSAESEIVVRAVGIGAFQRDVAARHEGQLYADAGADREAIVRIVRCERIADLMNRANTAASPQPPSKRRSPTTSGMVWPP